MKTRLYRWLLVGPLLAAALFCAAGGAVHGFGKDVEGAGQGIENLSDETRNAISR